MIEKMGTQIEKLLGAAEGSPATVEPDYIVINDGISNGAADFISNVANPSKVLVIFDHDVPTGTSEAAAVFRKINSLAKQFGTEFVQAQGVGYSWMLAGKVEAGQIVVTGGSHSAIFGAKDALGVNVSNMELARVVETGRYSVVVPATVRVKIIGALLDGVSMMDAAMHFLKSASGLKGKAIEFFGSDLTVHEKAVLCSMACGTGAFTAIFTDDMQEWDHELELDQVVPMVVRPCAERYNQGNAKIAALSTLDRETFQAGQIGGYTGGSIEDLRLAARMVEGKKLALGFRLTVCPATSADYIAAMEDGTLEKLIDYGAQIHAAGDHSVNRQGAGVIGSGEKLLTTGLYTYAGCMGCEDSEVYTASVQTVMNASINAKVVQAATV